MNIRTKVIGVGISVLLAVAALLAVHTWRDFQEFRIVEECKGYWLDVHKFQEETGRLPENEAELASFYATDLSNSPVYYVKPTDDKRDEVVIWWKEIPCCGKRIGVTESGMVVKQSGCPGPRSLYNRTEGEANPEE